MLTLEQHMVDLMDLRDIAKAGAQQRPGDLRGWLCVCRAACPSRLDGRCRQKLQSLRFWRRASVRTHEIGGCGKVLVPTLRNGDIVFMDEIAQLGACKRHAANTSLT